MPCEGRPIDLERVIQLLSKGSDSNTERVAAGTPQNFGEKELNSEVEIFTRLAQTLREISGSALKVVKFPLA
jgi:hypothetical protein